MGYTTLKREILPDFRFFLTFAIMDDFKIWFYVILGAVYLLSRLRKKQNADAPEEGHTSRPSSEADTRPSSGPKQLTFDELLREITQGKEPVPEPKPAVLPRPAYVNYDDDLKEEEQDLEDVNYDYRKSDPEVFQTYEEAKRQAFNRPSLEETMKVEDTIVNFSKFKMFEDEQKRNLLQEYTRDLQDPEGLKKAVVLSEILNRRF